jgi:DNA (cytosine-5)-methyltransferase 1
LFGLSLCAGAGGLDLGLHIAVDVYRAVGYVEREAYAAAVLVARMEDAALDPAPLWDNVATFDGLPWRGAVDIVLAGYPCQPFSVAGRRRGADDPRHLWPHVARIVGECEPPFVFLENVAHHLRLGFPEVAGDLVGMGYRLAAGLFTAAEVGAPHRRERLFVLAHRDGPLADPARLLRDPVERRQPDGDAAPVADAARGRGREMERRPAAQRQPPAAVPAVGDADGARPSLGSRRSRDAGEEQPALVGTGGGLSFPPGPADADGWAEYLRRRPDAQPAVRRGADGLAHRVDRLRLCGNGVVPLVAAHALRTLAAELSAP